MPDTVLTRLADLADAELGVAGPDTVRADLARGRRALRHRRMRRGIGTTVLAAAVAIPGLTSLSSQSSPAYAVETESNGDVVVTVHRLGDSAGLETALAAHGVTAQVHDVADLGGPHLRPSDLPSGSSVDPTVCAGAGRPSVTTNERDVTVTIPAATVATGQQLFIWTAEHGAAGNRLLLAFGSPTGGCATSESPDTWITWGLATQH